MEPQRRLRPNATSSPSLPARRGGIELSRKSPSTGPALRILVCNDDGIHSEGLLALARALEDMAEVWVVAPDRERSAVSHSLSMGRPLRWKKLKHLGPRVFAGNGTPTDCILLGATKILPEKPHLIVSGINKGENLGDDITYSGTVS